MALITCQSDLVLMKATALLLSDYILKYFAIFHENSLFMEAVDCWYIVNWVWKLTILCFALLVQSSKLLNKNYGIIFLRLTVPGSQHRHSTYQFLFTVNVNTNTFIFTRCCSVLFIYWVSVSQFDPGWHIILVGHLDFVQLTRFSFHFPRLGISLFTIVSTRS